MRSCISKTYAEYDANIPEVKEFAKLWIDVKKGKKDFPVGEAFGKKQVRLCSSRSGFVGSGNWTYKYDGKKFSVYGSANGKGFWGTDYYIDLV